MFKLENITNIELSEVNYADYPYFNQTIVSAAIWGKTKKPLTFKELEYLNQNYSEFFKKQVFNTCTYFKEV